jgi:hypothetical protein
MKTKLILCLALILSVWRFSSAAGTNTPASQPYDFASPRLLTGALYATGSIRKEILYTFRRTATRSGSAVSVQRQFFATNGSLAAVENIVYESGRLVSLQMQEFQAQISGAVQIAPDPKNPAAQKLIVSFGRGLTPPKGAVQNLPPDTVIDDSLYPLMLEHWDELMRGDAVKFRFVSLEWKRTFEFRFLKTAEAGQGGRTVEQIKMEPVSLLVAGFIKPLVFTVEKDGAHRVLSYTGRTTPRIRKGNAWKYLDAETVFDWQQEEFNQP